MQQIGIWQMTKEKNREVNVLPNICWPNLTKTEPNFPKSEFNLAKIEPYFTETEPNVAKFVQIYQLCATPKLYKPTCETPDN